MVEGQGGPASDGDTTMNDAAAPSASDAAGAKGADASGKAPEEAAAKAPDDGKGKKEGKEEEGDAKAGAAEEKEKRMTTGRRKMYTRVSRW